MLVVALAGAWRLSAQEVTAGVGAMRGSDTGESSYTWQLDYRSRLGRSWAWSASWINEGHVDGHHRDGIAGQIWVQPEWPKLPLALSLGAGAYGFFDTQAQPDRETRIRRGFGPIASMALTYYTEQPWFWRLTLAAIRPSRSINVNTLTFAAGYGLDATREALRPDPTQPLPRAISREITVLFGKSVSNATGREGFAAMVEYRASLARNWEWTLAALREGKTVDVNRDGATAQIWLVDSWRDRRFSLGIGAGGYYSRDRARPAGETREHLMGLVSPTAAWRFSDHGTLRVVWHRVISDDDRDTDADVFLLGIGRAW